jgi:hypothetical protein
MGPSNENSYQVWFQLAQWLQRRLKCKIYGRRVLGDGNTSHDPLGQVS